MSILDEVIKLIRGSKDKRDAKLNLQTKYDFSEKQAEAIVSLQLYRLTNTDIHELQSEAKSLAEQISVLEKILGDEAELIAVLKEELAEIKKNIKLLAVQKCKQKLQKSKSIQKYLLRMKM